MDGFRDLHEDAAGAPGAAQRPGEGGSLGGAHTRRQQPAGVRRRGRGADFRQAAAPTAPEGRDPARAPRLRSSFRDWAAEETDHPREVIEAALAHVVQNRVEAAYRRTDLFERRRRLMNDWAIYLAQVTARDSEASVA